MSQAPSAATATAAIETSTETPEAQAQHARPGVLQVLPALESGGVERGTLEIAEALIANGFRSYVASEGGALVSRLEGKGSHHFTLPMASKKPLTMLRNVKRLKKIINQYGIGLIHARSRAPAWSAYFAAKQCGIPYVTTFHGHYSLGGGLKKWYNSIMTRGDRVIAISDFTADHIQRTYHPENANLVTIHRGVDVDIFNPKQLHHERMIALTREWQLPDEGTIILAPGRITRWKGQSVLVEALAQLPDRDFLCIFLGDDSGHPQYRRELERKVLDLKLAGNVRFAGATLDMVSAYTLAHIVVVPSLRPEAFGRVPAEAGAMQRPVIATNHGGARETVIDGSTGWLVKPGSADALAKALHEAMHIDKELYDAMGKAAREHICTHFNKKTMCDKTLSVYRELLGTA